MPKAGSLRNRIKIQDEVQVQNPASGEVTSAWQVIAETWAEFRDLRGRELFSAQQAQSEVTSIAIIRRRKGLKPNMRVVHGDRVLEIDHILEPDSVPTDMHLMLKGIQS